MLQRLPAGSVLVLVAALGLACEKQETGPEGPGPEVVVATVEKQDVEIYSEWVGTTTGFVNAQIYPKIQGYLLKQAYRDGGYKSAHLEDTDSELVVVDSHSCQANPHTVEEVRRILLEHLGGD